MDILPNEILYMIVTNDVETWRNSVLSMPFVWRLFGDCGKRKFEEIKTEGRKKAYTLAGRLHRKDGPAIISHRKDGTVKEEEWWLNGKRHRDNGPALIEYSRDQCKGTNFVYMESWFYKGKRRCRKDGPDCVTYFQDGKVSGEFWYDSKGFLHREDKPAIVSYFHKGGISYEIWYREGRFIRRKHYTLSDSLDDQSV